MKIKRSLAETYPKLAREWNCLKNGSLTPDKIIPHSDIKVWWTCPACGLEYSATVNHRVYGTGCPKCGVLKSAKASQIPVAMLDPNTRQVIKEFESITAAAKEPGI